MWRGRIAQIANGFKDRVIFAVADDERENDLLQQFGLGETGADMNIGCKNTEGQFTQSRDVLSEKEREKAYYWCLFFRCLFRLEVSDAGDG